MADKIVVHTDSSEVDEGILDHQVQDCPRCNTELEMGYGLGGGGIGVYGFCPKCERIIWKCEDKF